MRKTKIVPFAYPLPDAKAMEGRGPRPPWLGGTHMKKVKRALFAFQPSDCAAAQQWLTELYEEGWELERLSRYPFWPARFIPRTRDGLRYCVDLNTNSHILDPYIAPDAYGQLVADSGWELVGSCGGLNVYRSKPGMDPAPIQTDPALERKRIWRLTVLPELIGLAALVLLLAVPFLLAARLGLRPAFPLRLLESNWELLGVPSLLLLFGWYPYQAFRALFLWWRAPGAASAPDVPKARRRAWRTGGRDRSKNTAGAAGWVPPRRPYFLRWQEVSISYIIGPLYRNEQNTGIIKAGKSIERAPCHNQGDQGNTNRRSP